MAEKYCPFSSFKIALLNSSVVDASALPISRLESSHLRVFHLVPKRLRRMLILSMVRRCVQENGTVNREDVDRGCLEPALDRGGSYVDEELSMSVFGPSLSRSHVDTLFRQLIVAVRPGEDWTVRMRKGVTPDLLILGNGYRRHIAPKTNSRKADDKARRLIARLREALYEALSGGVIVSGSLGLFQTSFSSS